MRNLFLIFCILFSFFSVTAHFRAATDTIDFGTFRESEGKKTIRTFVINEGDTRAAIMRVKASCGCTATDYLKEMIEPGDSAWIDVTYNPNRRPGRFQKTLTVYGPGDERVKIGLHGTVIGSEETLLSAYPVEAGPLRLTERTVMLPSVKRGETRHVFINAYNISDYPATPLLEGGYNGVEIAIQPDMIPAGEIGTLAFYINTRLLDSDDTNSVYRFTLYPDGEKGTEPIPLEIHINITD